MGFQVGLSKLVFYFCTTISYADFHICISLPCFQFPILLISFVFCASHNLELKFSLIFQRFQGKCFQRAHISFLLRISKKKIQINIIFGISRTGFSLLVAIQGNPKPLVLNKQTSKFWNRQ